MVAGLSRPSRIFAVLLACGLCLIAGSAHACVVCIPYPKRTHADILIESESVVLARENPDRPFSYRSIEALKGAQRGAEIDLFLDSQTRRSLAAYPEWSVVLARKDAKSGWRNLGIADLDYAALVRTVIARGQQWASAEGREDRLDFFEKRLGHANAKIRTQAYLEIGRAPYARIRAAAAAVPRRRLRGFLEDWRHIEWHALYILMLAQSDHADDRALIRRRFELAARHRLTRNLSAWATAYIEVDGRQAIDRIEDIFVRGRERRQDELVEIAKALSVHGRLHLRNRIVQSYAALIDRYPVMAGLVARDLTAWKRWDLADRFAALSEKAVDLDLSASYAIDYYVRKAREIVGPAR